MSTPFVHTLRRNTAETTYRQKSDKEKDIVRFENDLIRVRAITSTLLTDLEKHSKNNSEKSYEVISDITGFHPQAIIEVELFLDENGLTALRLPGFDGIYPKDTALWARW